MPASEKFTVDLSAAELPEPDLGPAAPERRRKPAKQSGSVPARGRSTVANHGRPAAAAKRYAFRRS